MANGDSDREADLRLVRNALGGDVRAIDGLVRRMRCIPLMIAARNARLGGLLDRDEVHDLAQDALVLVWRKLESYAGLASLESWVYPFCTYTLMNAMRARQRHPRAELLEDEPVGSAKPDDPLDLERVHRALERIEYVEAAVIRLKHFEERTFEEIADRLAIPINTAKSRYYRGLRRLRDLLASTSSGATP